MRFERVRSLASVCLSVGLSTKSNGTTSVRVHCALNVDEMEQLESEEMGKGRNEEHTVYIMCLSRSLWHPLTHSLTHSVSMRLI